MKKIILLYSAAAFAVACATNPLTGKKKIAITSEDVLIPTAFQQYSEFKSSNKVITGTKDARMVQEVGDRIKEAAIYWMTQKGFAKQIKSYQWEYLLFQNDAVNAWCMPGGKIAVFSGIMPIAKNENGLATVMGHEVAHALLAHSRSRVDAAMGAAVGAGLLGAATSNKSQSTQEALQLAYGTGTQLGMMAYGRSHESEADHLGLILMTIAGYNPDQALDFWGRMSKVGGANVPEFLSTHPSHNTRVNDIQKLLPSVKEEAAKYKLPARTQSTTKQSSPVLKKKM